MMLEQSKNIFFLGIKGVAMANLAVILKKMGKAVFGCDIEEEFITDKLLLENNISWMVGFDSKKLPNSTDLIVYSAAHGGTSNKIIVDAISNKIKVISQVELLGELMNEFKNKIAVSGCHGKTTTSSLLVYALNKLAQKPSYLVGTPFFTDYQGGDFQGNKYFVVEADEYGVNPPIDKSPKFHLLNPNYIIATNIDFDHPDVYKDIEETKQAFLKFFGNKKLFICIDDKHLMEVATKLNKANYITYGFSDKANYQIVNWNTDEDGSSFYIKNYLYRTSLFGEKNISNVAGVITFLLYLGFSEESIRNAIIGFTGAKRRFEKVYFKNNIYLFDDYAHHPTEITATIKAAKERFKNRRVIIIFQPHTYSRTSALLDEFSKSLSLADIGFVLPIFASARENITNFKISSKGIVNKINSNLNKNFYYSDSNGVLIQQLSKILKEGDVVFTMGAGDVYKLNKDLISLINSNLSIKKNVDLIQFNTMKTASIAEYFMEATTREDLIDGKNFSLKNKLPLLIMAGGSNLVIVKDKIEGLVIRNNYKEMKILKETAQEVTISVSSGYPVSLLVNETVNKGYEGFENHKGLPGTVGGAIYMNSKWTKPLSYFGDCLEACYLIDSLGKVKKVDKNYFKFNYDYSLIQETNEIILEAIFKLKKVDPEILKERASLAFEYRKKTQPVGVKTSGCFFKNVDGKSAGQLIDLAGLKGYEVGDFVVSTVHANFIINRGNGQSKDLLKLVSIIKEKVKSKFGIDLEEEVVMI